MTNHNTTLRQAQPRTSASSTHQRSPEWGLTAALILIAAVLEYVVTEAITAAAWKPPVYSYASNWISDLGAADCNSAGRRPALARSSAATYVIGRAQCDAGVWTCPSLMGQGQFVSGYFIAWLLSLIKRPRVLKNEKGVSRIHPAC